MKQHRAVTAPRPAEPRFLSRLFVRWFAWNATYRTPRVLVLAERRPNRHLGRLLNATRDGRRKTDSHWASLHYWSRGLAEPEASWPGVSLAKMPDSVTTSPRDRSAIPSAKASAAKKKSVLVGFERIFA